MDFVAKDKMYTNLLKQIQETYQPIYQLIMVSFFSGTTLTNNKINQFQSLILSKKPIIQLNLNI
jgi:hypothetical protein